MKLSEITEIINGITQLGDLARQEPVGYSIDSRNIKENELFFAIKGEVFDGHDFAVAALERGAIAIVVSKSIPNIERFSSRLITVEDVLGSLQGLASEVLRRWGRPVIGITGSAGKTTTKELTALVLEAKGRVHKSVGNLNNAYGLPLSVLKMESNGSHASDFDFAVLEMGMSTPGEIRRLCQIAPPSLGAVLNVNAVHLEFFENLQGIANAKAELIEGLKPDGVAVLNADDSLVAAMHTRHKGKTITFGIENTAKVYAKNIEEQGVWGTRFCLVTTKGETEVAFPLAGRHLLYNALVAASIGDYFGLTPEKIAQQLYKAHPASHRGEILNFKQGFVVIDDSYNSNPRALDEMVKMLTQAKGFSRLIVVAGEMLELGASATEMHQNCGKTIAESKTDLLIGVRGLAKEIVNGAIKAGLAEDATYFAATVSQASEFLVEKISTNDLILIKGSRGVKTDLIIEQLKEKFTLEKA